MNIPLLVGTALRPPRRLSVAEWADEYRILPATSAEPGRWRTSRTPYLREPMEALTPGSGVRTLVLQACAQLGKTEVILNAIGHMMMVDPGPGLVVQPTKETSREWSQMRLKPMIDATPELADMFGTSRRNADNKTAMKTFPGGFLAVGFAASAAQLRSKPIRYAFGDEIDGWPGDVAGEGDPVELMRARTRTFSDRKREVFVSTPLRKGSSRIEKLFSEGDCRRYHLPCPSCGEGIVPKFDMLTESQGVVYLECPHCRELIGEEHKSQMLRDGVWIADKPDSDPAYRSYHLNALYSPPGWFSWRDIFDAVNAAFASGDPKRIQSVVNTILGEAFADAETEGADWERLYDRRGGCRVGVVPIDVAFLTAGVDVQGDRLEVEVVGWAPGLSSFSVEYLILYGDPTQRHVWEDLDDVLEGEYLGEHGAVYEISRLAIDSGFATHHVYNWARRKGRRKVVPIKGSSSLPMLIGKPKLVDVNVAGKTIERGCWLWTINVDELKAEIYRHLTLPSPVPDEDGILEMPAGWCTWPRNYPPEYFKGLCGEQRERVGRKLQWVVTYKRNEPLDCRVYAYAAALTLGAGRWSEQKWINAQNAVQHASKLGEDVAPALPKSRRTEGDGKKKKRRRTRSKYLGG